MSLLGAANLWLLRRAAVAIDKEWDARVFIPIWLKSCCAVSLTCLIVLAVTRYQNRLTPWRIVSFVGGGAVAIGIGLAISIRSNVTNFRLWFRTPAVSLADLSILCAFGIAILSFAILRRDSRGQLCLLLLSTAMVSASILAWFLFRNPLCQELEWDRHEIELAAPVSGGLFLFSVISGAMERIGIFRRRLWTVRAILLSVAGLLLIWPHSTRRWMGHISLRSVTGVRLVPNGDLLLRVRLAGPPETEAIAVYRSERSQLEVLSRRPLVSFGRNLLDHWDLASDSRRIGWVEISPPWSRFAGFPYRSVVADISTGRVTTACRTTISSWGGNRCHLGRLLFGPGESWVFEGDDQEDRIWGQLADGSQFQWRYAISPVLRSSRKVWVEDRLLRIFLAPQAGQDSEPRLLSFDLFSGGSSSSKIPIQRVSAETLSSKGPSIVFFGFAQERPPEWIAFRRMAEGEIRELGNLEEKEYPPYVVWGSDGAPRIVKPPALGGSSAPRSAFEPGSRMRPAEIVQEVSGELFGLVGPSGCLFEGYNLVRFDLGSNRTELVTRGLYDIQWFDDSMVYLQLDIRRRATITRYWPATKQSRILLSIPLTAAAEVRN
jgi:hypothetical protein